MIYDYWNIPDSLSHRASVRAKLAVDQEWQSEYFQKILPWFQHQDNMTLARSDRVRNVSGPTILFFQSFMFRESLKKEKWFFITFHGGGVSGCQFDHKFFLCIVTPLCVAKTPCSAANMPHNAADRLYGAANTATFTAFTSFSFSGAKNIFSKSAQKSLFWSLPLFISSDVQNKMCWLDHSR